MDEFFKIIFGAIIGSFIGPYLILKRQYSLTKNWELSKEFLPILQDILVDLDSLYYAFLHKGTFCPPLEPRQPKMSFDGKDVDMSYADRGFQFLQIGNNIIKNCRKIIYALPNKELPNIQNKCKNIVHYFTKQEEGKKRHLDYLITHMLGILDNKKDDDPKVLSDAKIKMKTFYEELDKLMEQDFSSLSF